MHGGNLVWAATLAGCSPDALLDFSASINPWGPPKSAIAAIQQHLHDIKAYPDPQYRRLRITLGQLHDIDPNWILPGNGVAELLTWVGRDLAALDETILLTPAFGDYQRALQAFGAQVQKRSLEWNKTTFGITDVMAPTLASANGGLLINNPHNPTGILFERDSILRCLEQFALVVVDEAFMDFLPPEAQQSVIDQVQHYPNLVVLRSLTKFYSLPGLRLGYAIAHPDRLKRWQQWRDPWAVNALAAAVGEVVVQDTAFQQQTWKWLVEARSQLEQGLARLPGLQPYSGAANFLLVRTEQSVVQMQAQLLQQKRILIRDCLSFPELGDRYFRVAVRSLEENQQLLDGLALITAQQ